MICSHKKGGGRVILAKQMIFRRGFIVPFYRKLKDIKSLSLFFSFFLLRKKVEYPGKEILRQWSFTDPVLQLKKHHFFFFLQRSLFLLRCSSTRAYVLEESCLLSFPAWLLVLRGDHETFRTLDEILGCCFILEIGCWLQKSTSCSRKDASFKSIARNYIRLEMRELLSCCCHAFLLSKWLEI